ncbi:phage portal protein [Pimelobacter simplex]|uniref:Phage portal protein n=1 Tax=Nocardioides simplex TaxID=2045 RepID=A0A0C5XG06_NOCSI|nr:phage portal protein [Pimelobacter simplex]AJR18111.1 Phage portal protein [Pimelobacter simplex]MCG8151199.1 phage portal protein [Pimelobacter simplex]GEB17208.1 chromosome partitioning protein ParA [Pimelobacter simplex]SFN18791.1 Phage portal protein, SPP1 Gp6-like [Pimelobacter simplex]
MPLSQNDVRELVRDSLWEQWADEKKKLDKIDKWYRWQHEDPRLPRGATQELKTLIELSKTPWLGLVVSTIAQTLYVDGYRSPEQAQNSGAWRTWNANDFDQRQTAVHRAALAYGYSYVLVTPGQDANGARSVMRGVSPRKMLAVYAEPESDDWPMFAMQVTPQRAGWMVRLYEEGVVHFLSVDGAGTPTYLEWREHGSDVCPVVRYTNDLDLDGRAPGEVEPLIPLAGRVDKTAYDRMLTQHFNSWKVRTVAGLAEFADNDEEANRKKLKLRQDDVLVAEDHDTKFGTLDETPLDGFISAYWADVDTLAGIAQVPATALNGGKVANLSADAIAELRAGLTQKAFERQVSFGKSHAQALRLAAALEGDTAAASDVMARVTWQDMQVRSMTQAADALGKYATMLGVPPEALWSRIPGVTKSDVDEWQSIAQRSAARERLTAVAEAAAQARRNPQVADLMRRRGNAD